jgi:hypothetical protein
MTIHKGYYNADIGVFFGDVVSSGSKHGTLGMRYVEGMCWGDFNDATKEFVPLTNPMRILKGSHITMDEDIDTGVFHVSGIEGDRGAEVARKYTYLGHEIPKAPATSVIVPDSVDWRKSVDWGAIF